MAAAGLPLPNTIGGVSVLVNGTLAAPLFYVNPGQISPQLPCETPPGPATFNGERVGGEAPFTVAASAPGIMVYGNNPGRRV